jgi:hypothetical protein
MRTIGGTDTVAAEAMGARPTGYVRGAGHHFPHRYALYGAEADGQIEHDERVPQGPERRELARALNEL